MGTLADTSLTIRYIGQKNKFIREMTRPTLDVSSLVSCKWRWKKTTKNVPLQILWKGICIRLYEFLFKFNLPNDGGSAAVH
jgi:hypothetical protein